MNGKFKKENREQTEDMDINLILIGITKSCSTLGINYGLLYVYSFYSQNQNEKLGLTMFLELCRADDTIKDLKNFSSLFAKCQLQRLPRSQGETKSHPLDRK